MELPNCQDLKYGIIYICYDPEVTTSSRIQDAVSLIQKIAYPFKIEMLPEVGRGHDNTLLLARRFNVGNIGQCATVSLRTSDNNPRGVQFDALHAFREKLFEIADDREGDIFIDEDDFMPRDYGRIEGMSCCEAAPPTPSAAPQDHTLVESKAERVAKKTARWLKKSVNRVKESLEESGRESPIHELPGSRTIREKIERLREEGNRDVVEHWSTDECLECIREAKPEPDLLQEESREVSRIERERKEALERIKREIVNYIAQYHDDPKVLMAELLRGKVVIGHPGRLLVNGDMKVVMPEYDEMEIKMPAMCRTLYILFMKLRKQGEGGIVLRNIEAYREDIIDIYSLVKPGADHDRVIVSVNNLCDPMSDSLNQTISRINRCVRNAITDKMLALNYCISGNRGEQYGIKLDPQYLELPRAVTD